MLTDQSRIFSVASTVGAILRQLVHSDIDSVDCEDTMPASHAKLLHERTRWSGTHNTDRVLRISPAVLSAAGKRGINKAVVFYIIVCLSWRGRARALYE